MRMIDEKSTERVLIRLYLGGRLARSFGVIRARTSNQALLSLFGKRSAITGEKVEEEPPLKATSPETARLLR
jgi:hypothetical protein